MDSLVFGIFMIIFATCLLLPGIYMATGHKLGIFDYRPGFKNLSKEISSEIFTTL